MKTKLICGLLAFVVILGCGGAGAPYVPDSNTTGGNFSVGGGGTQTINPGQIATFPLQIMLGQFAEKQGRSPSPVTLSVTGLPANSTASFSANPVAPTDPDTDVTMTVASQAATPVGTYTLTVTGDDGTSRQTLTCTLNVNPIEADFNMVVEAQDGNMTNQQEQGGGKIRRNLIPDDTSAQYAVFVQPPAGYAGQVRVEYRFIEVGAPTAQDISAQFSSPAAATSTGSFTFSVVANVNPDTVNCLMTRLRQPIPAGTYTIEFKVVPLVAGYNGTTRNATLNISDNSGVQNRGR